MAMTRRLWKVSNTYDVDGTTLLTTEYIFYDKPEPDAANPAYEMKEDQRHCTVHQTESEPSTPEEAEAHRHTAGDLTAGQRTKVSDNSANEAAVLARLVPLNPGP